MLGFLVLLNGNGAHSPVYGVQCVWLVVVSPLVVAHVNRNWRMERGEDVMGGCRSKKKSTDRVVELVQEWSLKKNISSLTLKER